jgi:hypothetical protein
MERGDKHGPRVDDAMARETEAISRTGHTGRAEESREPEPSGEGQPDVDYAPDGELSGGTPDGMTSADVEGRAELARFVRPSAFPATAADLLRVAREEGAPDRVVGELERLRSGSNGGARRFENVQDVWQALGHGVETHRN